MAPPASPVLRAVVARDGPDPGLRLGSSPLLFGSTLNATARPQSCARTLAEHLWMPALAMNARGCKHLYLLANFISVSPNLQL